MTHEVIEPLPFQPPSPELLDLLHWLDESHRDLQQCTHFEYSRTELRGLGELTSLQTDVLLSGRAR